MASFGGPPKPSNARSRGREALTLVYETETLARNRVALEADGAAAARWPRRGRHAVIWQTGVTCKSR